MSRENSSLLSLKGKGLMPSSTGLDSNLLSRDQGKLCESITNTVIKVRRRKTKKERNGIKFKTHKETFQKKGWLRDYLRRHDGFANSHGPKIAPLSLGKKGFISKQVFITQDRLTQHQGIFDHEVKSVNIERFVRETTEVEAAKSDAGTATKPSGRRTPVGHMELSLDLMPTPEVKDQEELSLNQRSSENLGSGEAETGQMKTQVSQTDLNLQQVVEKEDLTSSLQGNGSQLQNTLSGSRTEAFPEEIQEEHVHEAVESINNLLSQVTIFPGRDLVSEIRQSIMEKVKELSATGSKMSATGSNPPALPVERKLDFICEAGTSTQSLWSHASEGETGIRKTVWIPQGHMQSTPVRFMPFPRDSTNCMPIKMVRPEGNQQILSPVPRQPVRPEPGYEPSLQHHLTLAENSPHLVTVQFPRDGLGPSKQDRDDLTCYRDRRPRLKHRMSVNADSPHASWTYAHNELVYAHNTHQKHIKRHANPRKINQGWLPGRPLQDVKSEQPNTSEPRVRASLSRENQPSFNVPHNIFSHNVHNSPIPKIFGVPPLESRDFYAGTSSLQSNSKNRFESHHNICYEDHKAKANRFQLDHHLGLRNMNHLSSPLGTDMDEPHDIFCTTSSQKWRNINVPSNYTIWGSPSSLREATHVVGNCDTEWHSEDSWSHRTSHQYNHWRNRPIVMPPTSVEQENAFVDLPYKRSLGKSLVDNPSPETWVYPRMKLY